MRHFLRVSRVRWSWPLQSTLSRRHMNSRTVIVTSKDMEHTPRFLCSLCYIVRSGRDADSVTDSQPPCWNAPVETQEGAEEGNKRMKERSHLGQSWLITADSPGAFGSNFPFLTTEGLADCFYGTCAFMVCADGGLEILCTSSCGLPGSRVTLLKEDSNHQCFAPQSH